MRESSRAYIVKRRQQSEYVGAGRSAVNSTRRNTVRTEYGASRVSSGFLRNRNNVRFLSTKMRPWMSFAAFLVSVVSLGLIFASQGTRTTSYDYKLSALEAEISDLSAKRDDLAVEKARLTSIAESAKTTVASNMETAQISGYAD